MSTLTLSFLSDDWVLLARLRELGPLARGGRGGMFLRPLTLTSVWLDHALWGLEPRGYHLTNLVLHGVVAACVAGLGATLLFSFAAQRRLMVAATAGVLFAASPSHAEPVAWLACRGDLLAAALGLGALLLWTTGRARSHPSMRALAVLAFAAALLAKESVVTLPAVVLLGDFLATPGPLGRRAQRAMVTSAPWWVALAAYLALRVAALGELIGGYGMAVHFGADPLRLAGNLARFGARTVLPWPVTAAAVEGRAAVVVLLTAITAAALIAICLAFRRSSPPDLHHDPSRALFFAAAFLLTLVPVVALGVSLHTSENERLLYLPSAFAALVAAELLAAAYRRRWGLIAATTVLVAGALTGLPAVLAPWRAASQTSQEIIGDLGALRSHPVALLTLPDSIAGAFVFRNGLDAALRLHGAAVEPLVVSYAIIADPSGRLHTYREAGRLIVRGDSPRTLFYSPFRDPRDGIVRRDAAGLLPAQGFTKRSRFLTVEVASFADLELLCPGSSCFTPCPP